MTVMELVQRTRNSKDKNRISDVKILDRFTGSASVRTIMTQWIDYMHMVKVGTDWKIINVHWELTPEEWASRGGADR